MEPKCELKNLSVKREKNNSKGVLNQKCVRERNLPKHECARERRMPKHECATHEMHRCT
jgi:hypothetical protein